MLRIALFLATNLAVMLVLGVLLAVLSAAGVIPPEYSRSYGPLLVMCGMFGFTGSLISLFLSKTIAKRSVGARVIEQPRGAEEAWLVQTVARLAEEAGIGMPEVAVYDSPDINAFATGARRNDALVAVSTGLLRRVDRQGVEGVLGHEVAHVANGDMVTLTLLQGVLNTFVLFFARVIGMAIDNAMRRGGNNNRASFYYRGPGYYLGVMLAELVLGVIATVIAMWFSRWREYRADAGGARLAGTYPMLHALEQLADSARADREGLPESLAAFGIRPSKGGMLAKLFSTHPPLDERIRRLRARAQSEGIEV
ncbi:MAG TPA: protease HtpX [Planctomycetes bacterium]|nr:protease HtpX [Planctomycetota bacterium]